MMTAGIGVEFAEAFGSEVDLRPRCRDKPSSAHPPRQFIRTQSRNLLNRENAVAPRFPQSRHEVHFGLRLGGRAVSRCRDKRGDYLAPLADIDRLSLVHPRFDAREMIPELSNGCCFHVIQDMSH